MQREILIVNIFVNIEQYSFAQFPNTCVSYILKLSDFVGGGLPHEVMVR